MKILSVMMPDLMINVRTLRCDNIKHGSYSNQKVCLELKI